MLFPFKVLWYHTAAAICCLHSRYYNQCCASTPYYSDFDRLDGPYRICTVQDGASTVWLKSTVSDRTRTVPPYSTILTVIWPFGSNLAQNNCFLFATIIHDKWSTRNQALRSTLSFHASHCWALPSSWCSLNPASGLSREALCGVNTWEEHAGGENGRFWGEEAVLRPFLHWQCQLGTVPYSAP